MNHAEARRILGFVWLAGVGTALYVGIFHREFVVNRLRDVSGASIVAGGAVYLVLGCLRGFTLIPVTYLLLIGLLFFPPGWLFALTLAGILASSASIYYFSEALRLDELLKQKHVDQIDRLRAVLNRYGLPIIIGWAFFPLAPTDLVVYLCGVLRIRIWTCLAGVAIGEGAICALYIFYGDRFLSA